MNGNRKCRKSSLIIGLILIVFLQTIIAAPTSEKSDNTKEKVSFEEPTSENSNEDEEVIELEDLKYQNHPKSEIGESAGNLLPVLEKLLAVTENIEEEKEKASQDSVENSLKNLHYTNPHHHLQQQKSHKEENSVGEKEKPIKTFRGAARLTYGQHPENDNDHTTTTTTTTTPAPTTTSEASTVQETSEKQEQDDNNEEFVPLTSETMTSNGQRRASMMRNDNAEVLLRHANGQYSAFDMAQYIFWTGDEAGVARAVEELIQEGLMSRENAIKFLHDIRLGIEYLENTYSLRENVKEFDFTKQIPPKTSPITSTTSTTEQTTTDRLNLLRYNNHLKFANAERENYINIDDKPTLSPAVLKAIEKLPAILKLAELNNKKETNQIENDDVNGRLRLADFLYAEYSLEEVIYQLAKTMFTQSLTHGSEQSQRALQRLTGFLEAEGSSGRISPALQKKILDVLLAALSDTLAENPELMSKARQALGIKI